jgi:hypothetical protein
MQTQTLEEWQAEMKERFGATGEASVSFVCPKCGRVTTIAEFQFHKIDAQKAPQNCIGRFVPSTGCNWAAYGLFLTMGKGRKLKMPDGGTIEVFQFGEPDGAVTVDQAAEIAANNS